MKKSAFYLIKAFYGKGGKGKDVTDIVNRLYGKGMRKFPASNKLFGRILKGVVKYFTITYYRYGRIYRQTVKEHTGMKVDVHTGRVLRKPRAKKVYCSCEHAGS